MNIISIEPEMKHFSVEGFNLSGTYIGKAEYAFTKENVDGTIYKFKTYCAVRFTSLEMKGVITFAGSITVNFDTEHEILTADYLYFLAVKSHEELAKMLDKELEELTSIQVDFALMQKEEVYKFLTTLVP